MADNKNVKQFKCMNFGACAKADAGEIIEIDALETLGGIPECPHCHQHTLEEVVKKPFPTKLVAGIAAAVLVLGGVGFGVSQMGGEDEKAPVPQTPPDTTVVQKLDTPAVETPKTEVATNEQEVEPAPTKEDPKPEPPKPQPPTSYSLGWGRYDGPMSGGKPNGFGGTITVSGYHSIDLKKASGETVEVNSGDKIMNVKMENGRLRQGEIHFADGTRRFISGL